MKRIATSTAALNKFGAGKNGWRDGNLAEGIVATQFEADFFDHTQEELAGVIEGFGVALNAADMHQASAALLKATAQIQPIAASVAANALTLTLNPTILDFRAADLTSGAVSKILVPTAISLVVSAGSTLGTVSAVKNKLAILAILYNGAVELAIANLKGGVNLDETTLISTTAEGGAGAADSATLIYSTTARANVPFRVVGYKESTQAVAGTWATAPSTIQGAGGRALSSMVGVGSGQTWQSMEGSRAINTTYYNTTGRPISVSITGRNTISTSSTNVSLTVDGVIVSYFGDIAGGGVNYTAFSVSAIIPPGSSYSLGGTQTDLYLWKELR